MTEENVSPQVQPIIDSVPGISLPPVVEQTPVPAREVVSIPEGEFKGDPRRVIGHPSNPASLTPEELFQTPDAPPVAEEAGQVALAQTVENPALITGIPPEIQNPSNN